MEQYEALKMEITVFETEDIITTSADGLTNWENIGNNGQ